MTYRGTNTYLVGTTDIAVIDPGPDNMDHMNAILAALSPNQRIRHVIVTHSHIDHSPLARPLADATGAQVYAFGDSYAGRRPIMDQIAASGLIAGGEGVDTDFKPDITVSTGDVIDADGWSLEVLHTPGHFSNHIALDLGGIWFTGDHVMGWATSLVSPPDGDLTSFMASCHALRDQKADLFLSGHGDVIHDPHARLDWLIAHRLEREAQIIDQMAQGHSGITEITAAIYTNVVPALLPMAERNVLAHVIDLVERNKARAIGNIAFDGKFELL